MSIGKLLPVCFSRIIADRLWLLWVFYWATYPLNLKTAIWCEELLPDPFPSAIGMSRLTVNLKATYIGCCSFTDKAFKMFTSTHDLRLLDVCGAQVGVPVASLVEIMSLAFLISLLSLHPWGVFLLRISKRKLSKHYKKMSKVKQENSKPNSCRVYFNI